MPQFHKHFKVVRHFMKVFNFILAFCTLHCFVGCNQKTQDAHDVVEVRDVVVSSIEAPERPPPPPPSKGSSSKFETIEKWLVHICNKENPPGADLTYHFGFSDEQQPGILYLYAHSEGDPNQAVDRANIYFYPAEMYYLLPKKFGGLSRAST